MKPLIRSSALMPRSINPPRPYICRNCLTQQHSTAPRSLTTRVIRSYSTPSPPTTTTTPTDISTLNPPPPPSSGFTRLPTRRLIALHGPDSTHFLNGITTASLLPNPKSTTTTATPRPTGIYSAFLSATGRILHDVFLYPYAPPSAPSTPGWLIEVDAAEAAALLLHLKRHKLRSKIAMRALDAGELDVWALWRDTNTNTNTNSKASDPGTAWTAHGIAGARARTVVAPPATGEWSGVASEDRRAPGMGTRLLLPGSQRPDDGSVRFEREGESKADTDTGSEGDGPSTSGMSTATATALAETTPMSYRLRRYLHGVPEGQGELAKGAALPQESNVDFMGGLDYRKGCYVGQELTIRTHHTGVVRKRVLPVMLYGAGEGAPAALRYEEGARVEAPPAGTAIGRVGKRGRTRGRWVAGVGNVGLAVCRLEGMVGGAGAGAGAGEGEEPEEFEFAWEGEDGSAKSVRVKAFVPSWHP